ncbi:Uncharacterised protein [Actinomyces bovis]|uniref:Uncharacterized protein n=1 Tax=Actinomyces bovis TaxID=1658 RepID=A0ABY1VQM8_9ACTO|nr:hypothetical protein [Actinomyces bovis]SPT54320.1 Uncharacterised protein [Actinomyces bovis]VEG56313.1 Uncharacterised protein [Actinomyces israelii]
MELGASMSVGGFYARSRGVVNGVGVEVLRVWGERALVREAGSGGEGQWVGLGEVCEVVVEQPHRLVLIDGVVEAITGGFWESRWRRVFPVGFDAWSSPERAGGLDLGVWSSFLQGPVPVSWQTLLVVEGLLYPCTRAHEPYYPDGGPAYYVTAEGWCQLTDEPVRLRPIHYNVLSRDRSVLEPGVEGVLEVSRVSALWGGRRVEVLYVAHAYAYVVDFEEKVPHRSKLRVRDLGVLDALVGPVRLDELEDIRFDVYVRERREDCGSWGFMRVWGLDGDLARGCSGSVRMERGCWQAWPRTHTIGKIDHNNEL